ncbi:MAG: hypothetical protein A3A58_01285 [Candidatus Blackburnbacteria bacterium RIFCSPLOWO2_01_FULL_41_27]|uniref:Transmembrane protein n=2 Tax=Candidatus Blackburniibacteriota TaxID=1817898 RepID=A0A1G1V9K3_9BACT|nr:MAG: hypothetical protein A3F61_03265 [Candidatus Blackburnbacteria bacterium RIFCSPHIGHO2_12_FULL_41_13b]OGY13361.1 MAG: hypothetical protein A3A58_01285 [Candidatus Blackburnbacteria bacterium RIFCSPLOWO2_01_FULL_41_27]
MSSVSRVMYFLGILLFLMGIYGLLRITHVTYRGVPYPSAGVMPSNLLFSGPLYTSYGRESDCDPYPMTYYAEDNKTPRDATGEEKTLEQRMQERCVQGFNEERAKTRQYDKNLSAFLVFVGVGLIFSRRFVE